MSSSRALRLSMPPASARALGLVRPIAAQTSSPPSLRLHPVPPRPGVDVPPAEVPGEEETRQASGSGEFLGRAEVARLFAVSRNTVTRWAREGRLASLVTLGGHYRFDRKQVEELQRRLYQEGGGTE